MVMTASCVNAANLNMTFVTCQSKCYLRSVNVMLQYFNYVISAIEREVYVYLKK
jgi:hypothetical protein